MFFFISFKILSFTLFNISSPSSLYFLSYFLYKFYITSFPPLSYIFFQVLSTEKVNTISISSILFLFWHIYIYMCVLFLPLFFFTNGSFCYCWFNFQITFFFLTNLFWLMHLGVVVFQFAITGSFSISLWFDLSLGW